MLALIINDKIYDVEAPPDTPEWHDAGIGIEFLEVPDDARALLTRHVDERLGCYRV